MPKLHVTLQDGSHSTHELTEDVATIGRLPDNVVQLDDGSVSSHHARLTLRDGDYILQDLGSTNGTRLNGARVEAEAEHPLQEGDSLRFGSVDAVYNSEVAAETRPMPVAHESSAAPSSQSVPPADFTNASPFPVRKKKKDQANVALLAFSILSLLIFAWTVVSILAMKAPELRAGL